MMQARWQEPVNGITAKNVLKTQWIKITAKANGDQLRKRGAVVASMNTLMAMNGKTQVYSTQNGIKRGDLLWDKDLL